LRNPLPPQTVRDLIVIVQENDASSCRRVHSLAAWLPLPLIVLSLKQEPALDRGYEFLHGALVILAAAGGLDGEQAIEKKSLFCESCVVIMRGLSYRCLKFVNSLLGRALKTAHTRWRKEEQNALASLFIASSLGVRAVASIVV